MGASLRRVSRLALKELRSLLADPVLLAFIAYVFTFAVYQVATGVKFEVDAARVAVVDEDRSALSRRIVSALAPPLFRTPDPIEAGDVDAAMDRGRYAFVVEIPPRLEADALSGKAPVVRVDVDATAMSLAGAGVLDIQMIVLKEMAGFLRGDDGAARAPVNLVTRTRFNPNLSSVWFTAVMQVVNNIALLAIILTGAALIREREHGTVEHLLVMPVTAMEIMLAKILANGAVIVVAALASLQFVVKGALGVPIAGSAALFIAGAALFVVSVAALGLLLATFARTMPQFGLLALPSVVMLYLLSGGTTPLETMPPWLQTTMQFTPNAQFVAFAQAVLYRGADLSLTWPRMAALAAISVALVALTRLRFSRAISAQE